MKRKLDRWGRINPNTCDKILEPITAMGHTFTGHNTYSRVCKTCPDYDMCAVKIMRQAESRAKRVCKSLRE